MGIIESTSRVERFEEVKSDPLAMEVICQRVAEGEALKEIAGSWQLPYGRLAKWIAEDEGRRGQYEGALALWADMEAQSCLRIADDGSNDTYVDEDGKPRTDTDVIARSKLRIDTRIKLASKWYRARYGDKAETGNGAGGLTIVIQQMDGSMVPLRTIEGGGCLLVESPQKGGGEVGFFTGSAEKQAIGVIENGDSGRDSDAA